MSADPKSSLEPSAVTGQILTFAAKLTEALGAADDLGGLAVLRGKMKRSTSLRVAETLKLLRAEINEQLADLDAPRPKLAQRTLLRRQANKPTPTAK